MQLRGLGAACASGASRLEVTDAGPGARRRGGLRPGLRGPPAQAGHPAPAPGPARAATAGGRAARGRHGRRRRRRRGAPRVPPGRGGRPGVGRPMSGAGPRSPPLLMTRMPTPRSIQLTYLLLLLGNTLAASFIWGINTLFLLDAGLSNTRGLRRQRVLHGRDGAVRGADRGRGRHGGAAGCRTCSGR